MIFGYCMNLVQKIMSLKQHLNTFGSLTKPYTCVGGVVQIVKATEWVYMLSEKPEFLNKVYTRFKYYSVNHLAFSPNILKLSIAT